jgi:hypothetical protein
MLEIAVQEGPIRFEVDAHTDMDAQLQGQALTIRACPVADRYTSDPADMTGLATVGSGGGRWDALVGVDALEPGEDYYLEFILGEDTPYEQVVARLLVTVRDVTSY